MLRRMKSFAILAVVVACSTPSAPPIAAPTQLATPAASPAIAQLPRVTFELPATGPDASTSFRLHKILQAIGREADTFVALPDGGVEAKATFAFRDRGSTVPLAAALELAPDGSVRRYAIWGDTSRISEVDERIELRSDGAYDVLHAGKRERVVAPAGAVIASGYAPMLIQDLVLRTWLARGRPKTLPLVTGGELAITPRGTETYDGPAGKLTLEHIAIGGLVWGIEDAWLDDKHALAAVLTRDAEFDHFEAARSEFTGILTQLAKAAGSDGVARLAEAARSVERDAHGPIALVGATLIDGAGTPAITDAVVVLDGDKIVAAGPRAKVAIPSNATSIDLAGKFLVPGLWDMHAHVEQVEQNAAYLAAGVTTVRDMGNVLEFITGIRDAIEAGTGLGPRILVNGLVDGEGPLALGTIRIRTRADIPKVVDRLKAAGCQEVKIYSSIAPELVPAIAAYAHAHGMRVVGHVPEGMTSQQAIDAGYDAISHINYLFDFDKVPDGLSRAQWFEHRAAIDLTKPAFTHELASLVAHHVVIDDTIALYEQGMSTADAVGKREPGLATLPRELAGLFAPLPPKYEAAADHAFAKMIEMLRVLHEHHVPIVAGTDVTVPGHSLHREIELYVQAGFTPLEALQAATIVPARYMHRDKELGTIEAGKRADLVVLGADPLADIHNIRTTELVIVRGKIFDSRALWQLAGFKALR